LAALATATLWVVTHGATTVRAEPPAATEADRRIAEEWASQVDDGLRQRDPGEASRLLLRAVRWDPTRWEDFRSALELLETVNTEAAARHAVAELRSQARFTRRDAPLLSRLANAALATDDEATWLEAAELAQAAAEQTTKLGPSQASSAAKLWAEAGDAYALLGKVNAASDAYEQLQKAALAAPNERFRRSYRWGAIAGCHLDAQQTDRAAGAIALLREAEGESAQVLTLQTKLALALDEPLAAVDHADRAIDKVVRPADETAETAYAALVAAMQAVNQSDRAADRLARKRKNDPGNIPLALATIDARANAGQFDLAWKESGKVIDQLTSQLPLAEGALGADATADPALLDALADVADRRLLLASRVGRVRDVLKECVQWAGVLGNLNSLWESVSDVSEEDGFRSAAADWLDDQRADRKAPAAQSQAQATIAYLINRPDDATDHLLAMLEGALRRGADADAVADECLVWSDYFVANRDYRAAQQLLRRILDLLAPPDADEPSSESPALGRLWSRLAGAIVSAQIDVGDMDPAEADQSLQLIASAQRAAPDDGLVAWLGMRDSLSTGRAAAAIAIGEEVFERWPAPDSETDFGARRFHETSELFAAALLLRDDPGDARRAGELLEESLDRWPQSARALSLLAWHDSRSTDRLSRALRLAEDAVRVAPNSASARGFLGIVQLRSGRAEEGIPSLRQALEPADGAKLSLWERSLFRRELANALRVDGRAEEAEVVESAPPAAD
jgi:hypothetical protein